MLKIHEAHGDYSHLKAPAKYTKKCIITILRKRAQHTQMACQRHQVWLSLTVFLCMSPNFLFLKPRDGPVSMSTGPHMSSNDLARGQWTSWNIFRRKSWFSIFDPYTAANNAGHHVVRCRNLVSGTLILSPIQSGEGPFKWPLRRQWCPCHSKTFISRASEVDDAACVRNRDYRPWYY